VRPFLCRFRADPAKVRVAIVPCFGGWRVTVEERETGAFVEFEGPDPQDVTMRALEIAEENDLDGIDLGMGTAYRHPWKLEESSGETTRLDRFPSK
jgi:hypothetical protein